MTISGGRTRREREHREAITKFGRGLCKVSQDTPQTVPAVGAVIEFDTETHNVDGWYSTTTFRYTPKSAGTYLVICGVSFATAPGALSQLLLRKNGTTTVYVLDKPSDAAEVNFNGSAFVDMNGVDDYLTIRFVPASQQATTGDVTSTYLHIVQIGYNKP